MALRTFQFGFIHFNLSQSKYTPTILYFFPFSAGDQDQRAHPEKDGVQILLPPPAPVPLPSTSNNDLQVPALTRFLGYYIINS